MIIELSLQEPSMSPIEQLKSYYSVDSLAAFKPLIEHPVYSLTRFKLSRRQFN